MSQVTHRTRALEGASQSKAPQVRKLSPIDRPDDQESMLVPMILATHPLRRGCLHDGDRRDGVQIGVPTAVVGGLVSMAMTYG